jgi:hypothetical protein
VEYLSVKNWDKHQHYRDRDPVWIKLYHRLLDNYEYTQLSDHDKLLFLETLMISARTSNRIPNDVQWLKRTYTLKGKIDFKELISLGFMESDSCYQDASKTLASCYQNDTRSPLLLYWLDNNLKKEFSEFRKMRNRMRKPITDIAEKRLIAGHKKLVAEGYDPAEIINYAIEKSWLSFFPPKDFSNENRKAGRQGTGQPVARTPSEIQREAGRKYFADLAAGNGNSVADDDGTLLSPVA